METKQSTLADLERTKIDLQGRIAQEKTRHERELVQLRDQLAAAESSVQLMCGGIDESKLALAKQAIYISGKYARAGNERAEVREEAIRWVLEGGAKLRDDYIATKNYAHWHGQSCRHSYGMGPRHGSVIFAIGLTDAVRKRAATPLLTEEEIDAAVYWLRNLEAIEAAQSAGVAAAGAA